MAKCFLVVPLLLLPVLAHAEAHVDWRLFTNVDATVDDAAASHPSFELGALDLFATAVLSEHIRAVAELLWHLPGDDLDAHPESALETERLHVDFDLWRGTRLRAGRNHSPLSYYNELYNHATLMQLGTDRPAIAKFEHDGGVLPLHNTGVALLGSHALTALGQIDYMLSVNNGRSTMPHDALRVDDENDWKAVVTRIAFAPEALAGAKIAISASYDHIPASPAMGMGSARPPLTEFILGGHLLYRAFPIDFISEFYYLRHTEQGGGAQASYLGGFAQLGVTFDKLTPYLYVGSGRREAAMAYLAAQGVPLEQLEAHAGVDYRVAESVALKLHVGREMVHPRQHAGLQVAVGL